MSRSFTAFGPTQGVSGFWLNPIIRLSPQRQRPGGLMSSSRTLCMLVWLGLTSLSAWAQSSANGTTVAGGNGQGSAANQFNQPTGVYVDGAGAVYIADQSNNRIQKWAAGATSGTTIAGGNGSGSGANQLAGPTGLYVDGAGAVYVADRDNDRVQKWAAGATSGTTVAGGNGRGSGANQLGAPAAVYVDGAGAIYVTDLVNNRIQKWAAGATSGTTVAGGNGLGPAANQFNQPTGVYVDGARAVYIADQSNNRIQKWAAGATSGTTIAGGNGSGSGANQLAGPTGLYVDGTGAVYVADQFNNRIQRFTIVPTTVTALSPTRNAIGVAKNTDVTVTLSQPPTSASALTVWSQQAGGKKAGTATVSGNSLTFNPTTDFKPGEVVFATATTASGLTKPQVYQFTTAAAPAPATFSGGSDVGVDRGPVSMAVGDVDGDGDLDILTANYSSNTVSVRLNDGSGNFSGTTTVGVGSQPNSVAVGDVDGDGDLDLLCANISSASVSVRLNDGSGTFSGGSDVRVGNQPVSVAVGDVDGDGDLDILTANEVPKTVSVRLNDGSGRFSGTTEVGVGSDPQSVAVGDVDGDGDLDILAANEENNNVSVRLNDGSGSFSGGSDVGVGSEPVSVVVGDVDGDGDLDILTANQFSTNVSVRLNDGSGNFSGTTNIGGVGSIPLSVALGDMDGDGDLDLLVANFNSVSVRLNDGSGTFGGGSDVRVGNQPVSVAVGDVDGDGDLDLLAANGNSANVSVRLNQLPPPTITGFAAVDNTVCVGSPISFTATVGNVTGAYAFTLSNGTSPLSGTATGAAFSRSLTASGNGTQSFTLTVGDNGFQATAQTTVTVNALPLAGLTNNGPLTCAQTSVTLTASGGSSYSFSAGAAQIGTSNRATVSAAGSYSVSVSDANGCVSTTSTPVMSNTAVVTVSNPATSTATINAPFSQAFTATGGVAGSPDHPYTFSLVSGSLPPGLSLATTGVLAGTPTQAGSFTLTVGATDANGCSGVSPAYVLSVSVPDVAGTLTLVAPTYDCQSGAITFRSLGGDGSGTPVEYRAIGVTDWTTNPNQVVDLPVRQDANAQPLTLQARQNGVMVSYSFDFRLFCNSTTPNQPPVFTQPPAQTATVGQPFAYRIPDETFRDLNGTAVNFMATNLPAGLSYAPDTRVISGTPTAVGSYNVMLSVSDPLSQSASGVLVIQVNPVVQPPVSTTVNQAPVFNGPLAAQSGTVGQGFSYQLPAGVFTDPNAGDVLTYSALGLPAGVQFVASSQRISGQPTTAGTYSVSLTATDQGGLSASGLLTITISTSATPPPVGAQPLAVIQPLYDCTTGAITFRTTGGDGSPIYFSSIGIVASSTQTSYVVDAPIRNDANSQPLLIKATQSGVTTSYLFDFRLYCNGTVPTTPPVFNGPLPTQMGTVGVNFSYQLPPNSFTALNGGPFNYSVMGLPAGLSFTAGSNLISGVPTQAGSVTATITATDPLSQSGQGPLVFIIAPAAAQPPVGTQPLSLVAPLYNCQTGSFTFQTSGGDSTPIEYFAVGITGFTTVAGPYTVRPAGDAQPFTLKARQSGVEVTYTWDFKAVCSGSSRVGVAEVAETWTLRSVGNPVTGELVVEVVGAAGQSLQLQLTDLNGHVVASRLIQPVTAQHREVFEVARQGAGVLLLQAQSPTRRQTLKVLKQ